MLGGLDSPPRRFAGLLGDLSGFFGLLGGDGGVLKLAEPTEPRNGVGCSLPAMPLRPETEVPGSESPLSPLALAPSSKRCGGGTVGGTGPPKGASGWASMDLCAMPSGFARLERSMMNPSSEKGTTREQAGGCKLQLC